jgi:hypothetical protein
MSAVHVRRLFAVLFLSGVTAMFACSAPEEAADDEEIGTARSALSLGSSLGVPVTLPPGSPTSTCGLYNGVTPVCTSSNASDITLEWTAPSAGTYTFTTAGSNFNTVLVLAPYGSPGNQVACANAVSGTGGETVSRTVSAGEKLLVTIDGYASLCGTYKLNISKSCTGGCNSPPNCKSGPGTCSVNGTCVYNNAPSGTSCNDGNACTTGDVCNNKGQCGGTPISCNNPPNSCYIGTCSNGACSYVAKSAGSTCSDGNACTTGDVCNGAGTCTGAPVTCDSPPGDCYESTGTCSNGACMYGYQAAGSPCSDGLYCTSEDVCDGFGSCAGTDGCGPGSSCTYNGCGLVDPCVNGQPGIYCPCHGAEICP